MTPAHDATALADRIERYLQDRPADGGHSDMAGGNCWELLDEALDALRASPQPADAVRPLVSVKPMALSDDRTDYFVSISVGDREITPYVFRDERFKAEYEAASFRWLLLGEAKPDLMAYSENDWPTPSASAGPQAEAVAWRWRYHRDAELGRWIYNDDKPDMDRDRAYVDLEPLYAHPQPEQSDGRGAVIEECIAAIKAVAGKDSVIASHVRAALSQAPATDGVGSSHTRPHRGGGE